MSNNLVAEQEVKELEKKLLTVTDKSSPEYFKIEVQINEIRQVLDEQKRIIKKAGKKGYRPNPIEGDCVVTGERIKANCGFTKKDNFGKWEVFSWDVVKDEIAR